jgi:transcriptional regulator with PAS, ATPase and Fis domain
MPAIKLTDDAKALLSAYYWNGNVRQLKNITEQISVIEQQREINANVLRNYLPKDEMERLPAIFPSAGSHDHKSFNSEREILYQVLFDMKKDMNDLKKLVHEIMNGQVPANAAETLYNSGSFLSHNDNIFHSKNVKSDFIPEKSNSVNPVYEPNVDEVEDYQEAEEYHEIESTQKPLSLEDMEKQMIRKTLEKHRGKRKAAADELKISERTLYRKIKEYGIE